MQDNENNPHWWAESHSISIQGWECVADVVCQPSWDVPKEVLQNRSFEAIILIHHQFDLDHITNTHQIESKGKKGHLHPQRPARGSWNPISKF